MNHDSEKWLDDRISEDVDRMADKRIKELMESEELKDIEATMDQLQSIRKRLGLVDAEVNMTWRLPRNDAGSAAHRPCEGGT